MEKNRVSAIIIARDEENEIGECLESIISANPDEIIVVIDDRTEDSTFDIAKRYTNNIYFVNGVRGKLRNFGWQRAKNEIVCFIDADARIPKDYFEKISPLMIQDENIASIGTRLLPIGSALCGKLEWILWDNACIFGCNSTFYNKKFLISVNGFNDNLESGEDADLHKRLKEKGWKLLFLDEPKAYHRFTQNWKVLFHKYRYGGSGFNLKTFLLFLASPIRAPLIALKYKCWHILWFYPLRWFFILFFSGKKGYKPIK